MCIFIYFRKISVVGFPVRVSSQVILPVTAMLLARSLVWLSPYIFTDPTFYQSRAAGNPVLKERCSDLLRVDVLQECSSPVFVAGGCFSPRWLGSNPGPYECLAGVLPVVLIM